MNKLTYQILLELKDKATSVILGLKNKFDDVDKSAAKVAGTADRVNTVCGRLKSLDFGNMLGMLDRAGAALQNMGGSGIQFEQSMADLSSITGIAGKDLADLGKTARQTGKDTGVGAAASSNAYAILASQIEISKIGIEGLKGLQKDTITLMQAGGASMEESATAMAATINQYGLAATESTRVINVLAAGSKYGAAEINDLTLSLKVAGATANAAGISLEGTAGAIEVLSKNNLKGAEAGTALRNIILKMQTALNVDFKNTSLSAALDALKPKLSDVTFLAKTFGVENVSAAQFLITNASAVDEMTKAVTGTNVAQEQAAIRTDTTAQKMARMRANIDDIKISFFGATGASAPYIALLGEGMPLLVGFAASMHLVRSAIALAKNETIRMAVADAASAIAKKTAAAATWLMSTAQAALNAVMSANPIALVVIGVAALAAGVIYAYKHSEKFRVVVDKVWIAVKKLAGIIWDRLVWAFNQLGAVLSPIWNKLKSLLGISGDVVEGSEKVSDQTSKTTESVKGLDTSLDGLNITFDKVNRNLNTMGGLEKKIEELKAQQKKSTQERSIELQKEITLLEKRLKLMSDKTIIGASKVDVKEITPSKQPKIKSDDLVLRAPEVTYKESLKAKSELANAVSDISARMEKVKSMSLAESIFGESSTIAQFSDSATAGITRVTSAFAEFSKMLKNQSLTSVQQVSGGLMAMGAIMSGMDSIIGGAAGSWLSWGANILAMVSQALPQLLALFGVQSAVAVATSATLPPPFNIVAIAATVAGIAGAIAAIPKPKAFADGGIVYGNTFAQVGEYAGASTNPEVIAPLNKLKQLIQPQGGGYGAVEFRISGRDLVGIVNKVNNINNRTR